MGSRFQEALDAHPAPRLIGTLRLRYEDNLLIGQTLRTWTWRGWLPEALLIAGFGAALICLVFLVLPGASTPPALASGLVAVLLVLSAAKLDSQRATPVRFVLNFVSETLHVDAPGRSRFQRTGFAIPFDDVQEVEVTADGPGTYGLVLHCRPESKGHAVLIAQGIPAQEIDELRRFWRFLRAAFGLRGAAVTD